MSVTPAATEQHYSVRQISQMWRISDARVRQLFEDRIAWSRQSTGARRGIEIASTPGCSSGTASTSRMS
jgi:hypothetical protein